MRAPSKVILIVWLLAAMTGCSRAKPVGLAIEGYNYTNRFIDSFTVTDEDGNGAWGGNVFLSSPTSGGGGGHLLRVAGSECQEPGSLAHRLDTGQS
jgi:hypothetical protein